MEERWKNEPDDYGFMHEGYKCIARRQRTMGHWLGFIIVRQGHPWYGVHPAELFAPVHGHISIADNCPFVPDPRPDEWWVGFECNQPFDLVPYDWEQNKDHPNLFKRHTYRTLEFVKGELRKLATFAKTAEDVAKGRVAI